MSILNSIGACTDPYGKPILNSFGLLIWFSIRTLNRLLLRMLYMYFTDDMNFIIFDSLYINY